jgi:Ankyrin repeats (many copies)
MLVCAAGWSSPPGWLLTVLFLGLITPETLVREPQAPEQARSGDYSFSAHSCCPDFQGMERISFPGDERLRPFLTVQDAAGGSMYPASVPLPKKMTITLDSKGGVSRTFHIDVPSVEHRRDYLRDLYVILQKDGTPVAKLILEPRPVAEQLEFKGPGKFHEYTLLPDDADPNYRQYRELCRATSDGDFQKVKRLLARGVAVEWADPHWLSALDCAREPKMVDLFLQGARNRLPAGSLAGVAAGFLFKNDCATADRVVQVLLKARSERDWRPALMSAAAAAKTDEPIRYVVQRLHLDPNMTLSNPGQGALYFAVMNGNVPVTKFLLTESKADPNVGLPQFSTLDRAEEAEHAQRPHATEIVKLLREHGARESERGPEWDGRVRSQPAR